MKTKLTFIVPTLNRHQNIIELTRLIDSLECIKKFKIALIIVESGDLTKLNDLLGKTKLKSIKPTTIFSQIKSSAHQRTLGLQKCIDSDYVVFIDDDIRFTVEDFLTFFESFTKTKDKDSKAVGAAPLLEGLFIANDMGIYTKTILSILSLKRTKHIKQLSGDFFPPGINIAPFKNTYPTQVKWFMSGCMMFEFKKIMNNSFDPYFKGYSVFEDVDYTYRIQKLTGNLYIIPIEFEHLETGYLSRDWEAISEMNVSNRYYIAQKHFKKSSFLKLRFLLYYILMVVIPFVFKYNKYKKHIKGTLKGLKKIYLK